MSKTWLKRPRASHEPTQSAEVDQLVVGEGGVQPRPERLVHAQMVVGVALGELGRQTLPLVETPPQLRRTPTSS